MEERVGWALPTFHLGYMAACGYALSRRQHLQVFLPSRRHILMSSVLNDSFPRLYRLPTTLPVEGAVRIEIEEGTPVFRASSAVQSRIEALLVKQRASGLSAEEEEELDGYEEVDDYLSFLNRVVRNLAQAKAPQGA